MRTRREFCQWAGAALGGVCLPGDAALSLASSPDAPAAPKTGSDIGSLFPFVERLAVHQDFPLSFLREQFKDLAAWKQQARGKLLELLHYMPPRCDPRAETLERVERDGYVREKVSFNTTPDVRVP